MKGLSSRWGEFSLRTCEHFCKTQASVLIVSRKQFAFNEPFKIKLPAILWNFGSAASIFHQIH